MLYDKTFSIDQDSQNNLLKTVNMKLGSKVQWQVGTDNGEWGHIYMFVLGDHTVLGDATNLNYNFRVRYVDN